MRTYNAFLPLAASLMIVGCGERGSAQMAVAHAERAVHEVRDQAQLDAPEQLAAAETTLARMQASFREREFEAVLSEESRFNAEMQSLNAAIDAKQTAATSEEWGELEKDVPRSMRAIQARVAGLAGGALPKGMTRDSLARAKQELEMLKATWAEAKAAASAGQMDKAMEKGRFAHATVEELKNDLKMNRRVASAR
jgi:hypothetical protein